MSKFFEELGTELSNREQAIYDGSAGLPEEKRQAYINSWKKRGGMVPPLPTPQVIQEAKPAPSYSCSHRSLEPTGERVGCASCAKATLAVYGCDLHGKCVLDRRPTASDVSCCKWCPDRPKEPTLIQLSPPPTPYPPEPARWISTAKLTQDAVLLASKLPPDVDAIVGVPRSGIIPAGVVATLLHLPLYQLTREGLQKMAPVGSRSANLEGHGGKYAVIDDTVYSGAGMNKARAWMGDKKALYAAVYVRPETAHTVDLYTERLPSPHILEWNLPNSGPYAGFAANKKAFKSGVACDFDGVLCHDAESGGKLGAPYLLPRARGVRLVVTGRHERHRGIVLSWFTRWGVKCDKLLMLPDHLNQDVLTIAQFKAEHYAKSGCGYFMESDPEQARLIYEISGRPVICPILSTIFQDGLEVPRVAPRDRVTPSLSVIVATSGRETLGRTLASITPQLTPKDEVIVKLDASGDWGGTPRQEGMKQARGSHLLFMDDDDVYTPDAFTHIRQAVSESPRVPLVFKMQREGGELWKEPVLEEGNVSTQMICVPSDRLGVWSSRYQCDYDFIRSTAALYPPESVRFVDRTICISRPPL